MFDSQTFALARFLAEVRCILLFSWHLVQTARTDPGLMVGSVLRHFWEFGGGRKSHLASGSYLFAIAARAFDQLTSKDAY
eukprot:s144_g29.t1